MMRWYAMGLTLTLLVPAGQERPDPVKEDLAKLAGTWVVVHYEKDGVALGADDLKEFPKLTIKGDVYTWSNGEERGQLKIDPTKTPKTVDYTVLDGDQKGQVDHAIYEINGDTWRDCIVREGNERPRAYTSPPGSGRTLVIYKRVK